MGGHFQPAQGGVAGSAGAGMGGGGGGGDSGLSAEETIRRGIAFLTTQRVANVSNNASRDYQVFTGNLEVFMTIIPSTEAVSDFRIREDETFSADGNALTISNRRRDSTLVPQTAIFATPITDVAGPTVGIWIINGTFRAVQSFLLKANTRYMVIVTNRSGSSTDIGCEFDWTERGLDLI